jgi:hypothetical protein
VSLIVVSVSGVVVTASVVIFLAVVITSSVVVVTDPVVIRQICYCPFDGGYTYLTTAELADKIEKMVADIKIDPKKISSAKRKLISVTDDRPSAKAIGSVR